MRKRRIAAFLALLLGLSMMGYSGAGLLEAEQSYREGNEAYGVLSSQIRKAEPVDAASSKNIRVEAASNPKGMELSNKQRPRIDIPDLTLDFEALHAINSDAAAWLYCPDTVIDYPVMKASDYSHYLNHLPDGTKNANGSLFIDYNCAPDFSSPLTVIYGHHMKSGRMFGSLVGYKDQAYYEQHPYLYLYTEQGNYRIDLMYGCVISEGKWRERAFMYEENVGALMAYAAHSTTFVSGMSYMEGDKVVALSTCSYEFDDARYVVVGILRAEYGGM